MYRELTESAGTVVGVEVGESFTEEDMQDIAERLEAAIEEHGSVRLLVRFDSLPRPELDALDDDIAFWLPTATNWSATPSSPRGR